MLKVIGHGRIQYNYSGEFRKCVVPKGVVLVTVEQPIRLLIYPVAQELFNYFSNFADLIKDKKLRKGIINTIFRMRDNSCYSIHMHEEGDTVFNVELNLSTSTSKQNLEFVSGIHHIGTQLAVQGADLKVDFAKKIELYGIEKTIVSNIGQINSVEQLMKSVSNIYLQLPTKPDHPIYLFVMSCMELQCPVSINFEQFNSFSTLIKRLNTYENRTNTQEKPVDSLFFYHSLTPETLLAIREKSLSSFNNIQNTVNMQYKRDVVLTRDAKLFYFSDAANKQNFLAGNLFIDVGVPQFLIDTIIQKRNQFPTMQNLFNNPATKVIFSFLPFKVDMMKSPIIYQKLVSDFIEFSFSYNKFDLIIAGVPIQNREYKTVIESFGYKPLKIDNNQTLNYNNVENLIYLKARE